MTADNRVRINQINRYKQYCINCLAAYQIWYTNTGVIFTMTLTANFFRQNSGNEPVRDWLNEQEIETKKDIGSDIRTIQNRWPLGMPLVRKISTDLWEVRTNLKIGIARVFFTINDNEMILLHVIIKKSQKTPKKEIDLAVNRLKDWQKGV